MRKDRAALILFLLLALLFGFDIGGRHISSPDEGRYIEIPREMVETGDYVLPRLNGILYFEKPPLFYWLEASAIKTFGISEWSMRLWPALLGLFGCFVTYAAARRFYGRTAGLVAGGVLATTLLYYALARFIVLDMAVSVFMSSALFAFLLSAEEPDERRALWYARAGHAAAAFAVLSKGLIGVLLPGLVGLVWIALIGRWSFVRRVLCPSGILIFLAIAAPWHVMAAMQNKDFLWFYFVHEHFMRFTTTVHRRYEPMWFFVPVLLLGFMPWTGYLWHALKDAWPKSWAARRGRPVELYLILWAGIVFVFFSISDSKLITYILPVFPPLAVLIGRLAAPVLDGGEDDRLPVGRAVFAATFGLLALAVPVAYALPAVQQNEDVGPHLAAVAPIVWMMAAAFALGVIAVFVVPRRHGLRGSMAVILVTAALGWTGVSLVASRADPNSIKELAETVRTYRQPGDLVVSYGRFFYDLPVYLEQKVLVVDNTGEFVFGMTQEDVSKNLTTSEKFWPMWNGEGRVFMLMRASLFAEWERNGLPISACVLGKSARAVALANKPIPKADGSSACLEWQDKGFVKPGS